MILNCLECKKPFALSGECSKTETFKDNNPICCIECGFLMPAFRVVGEARWGEFCDWINRYNQEMISKRQQNKPKSLWDIVVHDGALGKILIGEKKLRQTDSTPSFRIVIRSAEIPKRDFILKKFNDHLNNVYNYGYIDPVVRCDCICVADDGRFFDI